MVTQSDDVFDLDDVLEIFGGQPKAGAAVPAPEVEAPAGLLADALTPEEQRLLEDYERSKRERLQREEQARQAKQAEERRILEEYERSKREAQARQERERQEAERQRQAEIEALRQKDLLAQARKQEEKRILAEYERARRARAEEEKAEQEASEARAQQALKELAQRQQAEQAQRLSEEQAVAARPSSDKHQRLLDLLGKVQRDLKAGRPLSLDPLPEPVPAPEPAHAPEPAAPSASALPAETAPVLGDAAGSGPAPAFTRSDVPGAVVSGFNDAMCLMLDETRKVVFAYLAPVIGIRAANTMLSKTLEKARAKAGAMLKDANWRTDGTLRDDGSLDADRLLKNAAGLAPEQRRPLYVEALREILRLRLQAVELGLGAQARQELLERLLQLRLRTFVDRGIKKDWVDMFYDEVMPN